MKPRLILVLLLCIGVGSYNAYNYFTGWKWAFRQSPSLVFYSLHSSIMLDSHPPLPLERVEGLVYDQTVVSDAVGKEELIEAIRQALNPTGMMTVASCFDPHHAVSTADGETSLLLCFECGQAKVITPRGDRMVPINRNMKPLFDSLIRKYHLKAEK